MKQTYSMKQAKVVSYLLDAYQHRPSEAKVSSRYVDVCLSITTVKRGWEDPLVENLTLTAVTKRSDTSEIPRDPNFKEIPLSSLKYKVDKTRSERDFIG
jgi:hypothetical protein